MSLLEVDSVIKYMGDRLLLSDIYLKCETGEVIGLLGRNGCGKSTLFNIIFGTLASDTKFVRIDGTVYQQAYKGKDEIVYLPQTGFTPKYLSLHKAVDLFLGSSDSFFEDELLAPLQKKRIGDISGGEKRYFEIKLVLHAPAKFILLDEPFVGLAPLVCEAVIEMIRQQTPQKGIILTDHNHRSVRQVASQIYLGSL